MTLDARISLELGEQLGFRFIGTRQPMNKEMYAYFDEEEKETLIYLREHDHFAFDYSFQKANRNKRVERQ